MLSVLLAVSAATDLPFTGLPVARAFAAAGHDVTVVVEEGGAARLADAGFEHVVVPPTAPTPPPDGRTIVPGVQQVEAVLRARLLDPLDAQWEAVLAVCARNRVDVVVTDPLFLGAALLALRPRRERPSVVALGAFPLPFADPEVAPFGLGLPPMDGPVNAARNVVLQAAVDRILLRDVTRRVDAAAKRLAGHGLPGRVTDALVGDVWAQLSVPRFEYPRRSLPDRVRFVGPIRPTEFGELPDWWFTRDGRPIVHVCHVPGTDPAALTVPAIRALEGEDVLVVVTAGDDRAAVAAALGRDLPANARLEGFVPFGHLLAEAAAMVTPANHLLVLAALRWGVPVVTAGIAADQVEVAARVSWSEAGVVLPSRHPTADEVRAAVRHLLGTPSARAAAARIAAQIARTDPEGEIVSIAEELAARRAADRRPAAVRWETRAGR